VEALELFIGPHAAWELIGKPYDIEAILQAVRQAVREARLRGFLGPASPGRGGEQQEEESNDA